MKLASVLPLVFLLAACATTDDGEYPSLAVRDAERATGTLIPAAPYVPPPAPPAVIGQLAQLSATVSDAHAAFQKAAPGARSAVSAARGGGTGSESWAVAQVAIAGLESARSRAMIALADFDRLYVEAATQGTELARIAAARDAAIAQVESEDATIAALLRSLQ